MKFIKKHFFEITRLVLLTVAAVFAAIIMFSALEAQAAAGYNELLFETERSAITAAMFIGLAMLTSLLGVMAYTVLALFEKKKAAAIVLIIAVLISILFFIISLSENSSFIEILSRMKLADAERLGVTRAPYKAALLAVHIKTCIPALQIMMYAILPLNYGIKKLLETKKFDN